MEDINKIKEEIVKLDDKKESKLWKEISENFTLVELLDKMTKEELIKVSKRYSLKGLTSLKKADVVSRIKDAIVDNNYDVMKLATEESLVFLKNILNQDGVAKYNCNDIIFANLWRSRGLVFTTLINDEPTLVIPDELKEVLKNTISKEIIKVNQENGDIIKAISGFAYYYGVIEFKVLKAMIERTFGKPIEEESIKALINLGEDLGNDYTVSDNYGIVHIDVEDEESIVKMQQNSKLEYYHFNKKNLIDAGQSDYLELNKQGQKLVKVLGELFVIDKEILREEMDNLQVAIKNEMDKSEAVDIFLEAYEIESDEERKILVEELEIYCKTIRRWSLKGYTEEEVEKDSSRVVNTVRIGRNDPCICGSGKKYKKCCG